MANRRPVVFVAGPISNRGTLPQEKQRANVEAATRAGLSLLGLGFAPIIPHLSWYVDPTSLFMKDWYEADQELIRRSDAVLRLPGESWGADHEVALAKTLNLPVLYSVLEVIRWHEAANGSTKNQNLQSSEDDLDPYKLIMTTLQGGYEGFSVLPATLGSENSLIGLISFKLPQSTLPHQSSARFYQLLGQAANLHAKKQSDYGRSNDPFANIRASAEWGAKPWVGAMIRATDKVRRLQKYATEGNLANESAFDSLQDLAVYALIAYVLLEEELAPK